jgi:ABC-type nitrate/sulfonate/bicarbonate transport system permease component
VEAGVPGGAARDLHRAAHRGRTGGHRAIVGDFFFRQGEPGIDILIDRYQSRLQSEQMVAAILLSSLLGIVVFWLFGFLARRVVGGWHESAGPGP